MNRNIHLFVVLVVKAKLSNAYPFKLLKRQRNLLRDLFIGIVVLWDPPKFVRRCISRQTPRSQYSHHQILNNPLHCRPSRPQYSNYKPKIYFFFYYRNIFLKTHDFVSFFFFFSVQIRHDNAKRRKGSLVRKIFSFVKALQAILYVRHPAVDSDSVLHGTTSSIPGDAFLFSISFRSYFMDS